MLNQIEYMNPKDLPSVLKVLRGPYREHIQRYIFAKKFVEACSVLDVACGTGYGSFELSGVAASVVGFEKNQSALSIAYAEYSSTNITYVEGDAKSLPFENETFDCVVCFETLEHLPVTDIPLFLTELVRVLKRGGTLLLSTPHRDGLSLGYTSSNPHHTCEFSRDELADLIAPYVHVRTWYGQEFSDVRFIRFFKWLFSFLPNAVAQRIWRFVRVLYGCSGEVVEYTELNKVPLYMIIECQKL